MLRENDFVLIKMIFFISCRKIIINNEFWNLIGVLHTPSSMTVSGGRPFESLMLLVAIKIF